MTHKSFIRRASRLLLASIFFAAAYAWASPRAIAQDKPQTQTSSQTAATNQNKPAAPTPTTQASTASEKPSAVQASKAASDAAAPAQEPLYSEFKGVHIGTARDDARSKLGKAQDKDNLMDFFVFSDRERARVYYDDKGKVSAIIVTYIGKSGDVPTPKAVLGSEIQPKQDGSMYNLTRYPKAGYWVAYSRTAGDQPLTIITMQKIDSDKQ